MDKGKSRETGIIGLTSNQPQEPPFALPSVEIAFERCKEGWPDRISPDKEFEAPPAYSSPNFLGVTVHATSSKAMGELLFEFVKWWCLRDEMDLTVEFEPPAGTTVSPPGEAMGELLDIIASDSTYLM